MKKEKKQKYERKKEVEDKTRNNNFAAALDYLKRKSDKKLHQKDLAEMLGVTENTISNIIHCRTAVSEDIITQLQTISGCVFNLQWLRGQSDVMLAANAAKTDASVPGGAPSIQNPTALLAAKDETIATLRSQLADKEEIIATKDALISALQQQIVGSKESKH